MTALLRTSQRPKWLPAGLLSERNVKLTFLFAVLGALTSTIAHGHIFTVYIFELYGDNASVGLTESIAGITALVTALPIGFAVDNMNRTRLLRLCACCGAVAAFLGGLAVAIGPLAIVDSEGAKTKPGLSFTALLMASLALWGIFFNASSSATLAIFADSVPKGSKRQELFAQKSTLTLFATSLGPAIAFALTSLLGNSWRLPHMVCAILPGFLIMLFLCMSLCFFEEVEFLISDERLDPLLDERPKGEIKKSTSLSVNTWIVPYLILSAEFITAVGAGMTVKFFGLWFKKEFGFSPAGLAALQAVAPLAIAAAVKALQAAVKVSPLGPIPAMLGFWLCSIMCLLLMTCASNWQSVVVLHLLRTALANCKEPFTRAILADFVPSSKRGRWNAIHSLTGMTWNGSAAVGGVLCDRFGYGKTFAFTAGIYFLASLCWLPLIRLVPAEHKHNSRTKDS